jgi:DNA-binding GntR family transcriptional regulator
MTTKGPGLANDRTFADVVDKLSTGYKTIGQMVYAVLKEAILEGSFAPGEWLRQESLATAIGVSRIPVRTALLQLESEGLVTFHPHRGARVRTLVPEQIDEIYRLRVLLESYALRRSIPQMSSERLDELKALADQLDNEVVGSEFLDIRVGFYRKLYDAENNPMLVQQIEELRSNVGRYLLSLRFDHRDDRHRHGELVDHAARGDVAAAEATLRTHLDQVREGLLRVVNEEIEARNAAQADTSPSGQFPTRS